MAMFTHYLWVAVRNVRREPLISTVNAFTLALGLVCFLVAYGVVSFWDRSERHFANFERTYVITTNVRPREGGERAKTPQSNPYIVQYLQEDFPDIAAIARARVEGARVPASVDDHIVRLFDVSVDAPFLEIFDLPFLAGNSQTALTQPRSAVLTEEAAARLFGADNPLGRTFRLRNLLEVTVTGVIRAIPEPSHMGRSSNARLRFDVLTSMDVYDWFEANARNPRAPVPPENWLATGVTTYVMFPNDGSFAAADLGPQLAAFGARHTPPLQLRFADIEFGLMPVAQILGESSTASFFLRNTGMTISTALLLLGALVLVVACINYANLATARATRRLRDVGIRKTFGASATQVMCQHLFEAALLAAVALAVALVCVVLLTPPIRASFGIDIALTLFADAGIWAVLGGLLAVVALASGAYPAFVLSRVRPVLSVSTNQMRFGRGSLSALLVGIQFAAASFLLITVAVTFLQNRHLKDIGLGLTADPLVIVQNDSAVTKVSPSVLRSELLSIPQVSAVGFMAWSPWTIAHVLSLSVSPEETAVERPIFRYIVGYGFFTTFEMPLLAGRVFDREHKDMPTMDGPWNIVVDRALVDELGLGSPENAVGQLVYVPKRLTAGFGRSSPQPMTIVGVVETQPLTILGTGPRSTIYTFGDRLPVLVARVSANEVAAALNGIDDTWKRLAPGFAVERRFVDEAFEAGYAEFARINRAFSVVSSLALLISVIGLFSMALLVAGARAHEIAIRKTFGAGKWQMIGMLLASFSGPVVVANLVAWPLAFLAAQTYLQPFIHPIELTPAPFVASLIFTVLLAWLVVAGQTWRAAILKPSAVLRAE